MEILHNIRKSGVVFVSLIHNVRLRTLFQAKLGVRRLKGYASSYVSRLLVSLYRVLTSVPID